MQQGARSYRDALLSNMVAGNGVGHGRTSSVSRFDDQDFDGWMVFFKVFLMKFDRADLALTEPMSMRDMNGDGEEYPYDDDLLKEAYQKRREKWLDINSCAYSYVMEACSKLFD